MCGLAGIVIKDASKVSRDLVKSAFSMLMFQNDDRGGHSWGVWMSGMKNPFRMLGQYEWGMEYMRLVFDEFELKDGSYLFGHTRWATHGERTVENAHPFSEGNLILAHNGVVSVKGMDHTDHAVDSGRIAQVLVRDGYQEGMSKVSGSCALLVTVSNQPLVYRHNQMLHYADLGWGVIISSDKNHITWVLDALALPYSAINPVPEDQFCQPGFGNVVERAPASKEYQGWGSGSHDAWRQSSYVWDGYKDDEVQYGSVWNHTKRTWEKVDTTPPAQNKAVASGNSDKKGAGANGVVKLKKKDTFRVDPELQEYFDGDMEGEEVDSYYKDYHFEYCDRCGTETETGDLIICESEESIVNEEMMCRDCICTAITTGEFINMIASVKEMADAE